MYFCIECGPDQEEFRTTVGVTRTVEQSGYEERVLDQHGEIQDILDFEFCDEDVIDDEDNEGTPEITCECCGGIVDEVSEEEYQLLCDAWVPTTEKKPELPKIDFNEVV